MPQHHAQPFTATQSSIETQGNLGLNLDLADGQVIKVTPGGA